MDLLKPFKTAYRAVIGARHIEEATPETPQQQIGEQIVVMGVPRAWLSRGIRDADFEGLFNEYLGELRISVTEAYGDGFEERRDGRTHFFVGGGVSVDYTASSTIDSGSDVNVYCGSLVLEQPVIDLEKAAQFLKSTMKGHLIAYQQKEPEFMVFHTRKGEGDNGKLSEGRPLLESMGIDPAEGCKFHCGGGVAVWYPVYLKLKPTVEV
ncbi:MAG TPA: hypothetical protein VJA47_02385 [archaeon]|nr:hypothetical protein [archaeon]